MGHIATHHTFRRGIVKTARRNFVSVCTNVAHIGWDGAWIIERLPRPPGNLIRRRLRLLVGNLHLALIRIAPLPAAAKWRRTLMVMGGLAIGYYQDLRKKMSRAEAGTAVGRSLAASGARWTETPRLNRNDSGPVGGLGLGQQVAAALDALAIMSTVASDTHGVVAFSNRCPYLKLADRERVPREDVCEMICGQHASLFQGMSEGLDEPAAYYSDAMMGRGDRRCIKRFALGAAVITAGIPLRRSVSGNRAA